MLGNYSKEIGYNYNSWEIDIDGDYEPERHLNFKIEGRD